MKVFNLKPLHTLQPFCIPTPLEQLQNIRETLSSRFYLLGGSIAGNLFVSVACSFALAIFTYKLFGWSYVVSMSLISAAMMIYIVEVSLKIKKKLKEIDLEIQDLKKKEEVAELKLVA